MLDSFVYFHFDCFFNHSIWSRYLRKTTPEFNTRRDGYHEWLKYLDAIIPPRFAATLGHILLSLFAVTHHFVFRVSPGSNQINPQVKSPDVRNHES